MYYACYQLRCRILIALQEASMKLKIDTLERERDFYFDKLRDIEILCQTQELASLPVMLPSNV